MTRHNWTGLVLFIFIIAIAELSWGQEESKTSLLKRLNDESRANLANKINSKEDLKRFQLDLLKKRNSQCVTNEELENFGVNFESISWDENISQQASFNKKCLDSAKLGEFFASDNSSASLDDLAQLVLGQFYNDGCDLCKQDLKHSSSLNTWLFGMLAATLITITSFSGAFLLPLTKHKHYKKILMFLISLAVGTLTGTAMIHLIPQAYGIDKDANYSEHNTYIWKSLMISGGLYLYFLVEQIMRFFIQFRKHRKSQKEVHKKLKEVELAFERVNDSLGIRDSNSCSSCTSSSDEDKHNHHDYIDDIVKYQRDKNKNTQANMALKVARSRSRSTLHDEDDSIAPVAWIIICCEGLHNFVDGLSIGAAFSETILKGFSLSLAIICEEFPHKLGDFAILLAAGMSFKTALTCNFLSSCLIYIGIAVGIVAGENLGISMWIYALAAGMFLYIAVCDMIPELSEMGQELEKAYRKAKQQKMGHLVDESISMNMFSVKLKISNMIVQNAGVLIGYFLMLILALYAERIVM